MWATGRTVVRLMGVRIGATLLVATAALTGMGVGLTRAGAAAAAPGWAIKAVAMPSGFSAQDSPECMAEGRCDKYAALVTNVGSVASSGPTLINDTLPAGVAFFAYRARDLSTSKAIACTHAGLTLQCADEQTVQPDASVLLEVWVLTEAGGEARLEDRVEVQGGGASVPVSADVVNTANATAPAQFGLAGVGLRAYGADGRTEALAGAHPQTVTSSFDLTNVLAPDTPFPDYLSVEEPKDVTVELPLGLVGDPQATAERCPEADLAIKPEVLTPGFMSLCPPNSRIGTVVLNTQTLFESSQSTGSVSALYNMVPEKGYPAVFGFRFIAAPVLLYARVVPSPEGYRLKMTAPNLPHAVGSYKVMGAQLSFFGVPNARNEAAGEPATALFRNPTSCSDTPQELNVRVEVDSWVKPGHVVAGEAPVYPTMSGCNLLQFDPALEVTPERTQADTPSGYEVSLKAPQPQLFGEPATPDLKNAAVTLPEGVALSPSAASGLEGCSEAQIDPLGTELGEGHPGGNASPYDDGLEHAAPGHCPPASKIGQVEIATPLLSEPLKGDIYVAQPLCGGEGQSPCTQASATDGDLYALYLEVAGAGVILKLKGKVTADPRTGRLTASFLENPQLPYEELKLTFDKGERAPLANPQTCGTATATSHLEPWSAAGTGSSATPTVSFPVVGCSSPPGFAPSFQAGVSVPVAGADTPFAMTLSRKDGEEDFGGAEVTLPAGLSGRVASVPRCEDAQANAGDCPDASRLGTAHVAAGVGAEPLWLEGPVYLTGPYRGAPFGLSIVIPTRAGPFDLGREVLRATIEVDPYTAQITTRTDPMPLIRDGIPFRLKTLAVAIDRPGFLFNPTSCARRQVSASVSGQLPDGTPGSTAAVFAPFAVAGCAGLPFRPTFSAATQARHSKKNGVGMHVTVRSPRGDADIASVRVEVPKILPSRLSTLNLACTEAQFASNPAGCPSSSFIGTATAKTPILATALSGPAIFVSHGGTAFPNLDLVLQGEGITIVLVGDTFIDRRGVTSSTFATLPDLPVERFDLDLPAGAHSALSASGDLCAGRLVMPTTIFAENGARVSQRTRIVVNGCKPVVRVLRHYVRGPVATVVARLPSAGVMVATSRGLSRTVKRVRRPANVTFKLRLSSGEQRFLARHPGRRLKALVRLSFKPRNGGAISTRITLLMG